MEALISSVGSVEAASRWLDTLSSPAPSANSASVTRVADRQSSLSSYTVTSNVPDSSVVRQSGPLTKKGQTLHLYTPEDIARHTPCSIIHNYLDNQEADRLLKELLEEAPTFEQQTFKLFDNVVQSPHSACFYVESLEEQKRQRTEYLYNGSYLTVGITLVTSDEVDGLGLYFCRMSGRSPPVCRWSPRRSRRQSTWRSRRELNPTTRAERSFDINPHRSGHPTPLSSTATMVVLRV